LFFFSFTIFTGVNIAEEQAALADAIALISRASAKPQNADCEKGAESDGGTDQGRKRRRAASPSSSSSDEDQRDSKKGGKKGRGGNCKICLYQTLFLPLYPFHRFHF
jgi:hypothetical protein